MGITPDRNFVIEVPADANTSMIYYTLKNQKNQPYTAQTGADFLHFATMPRYIVFVRKYFNNV